MTPGIRRYMWVSRAILRPDADFRSKFAVGKSNVEVIKVLLQMGSDPYLENRTQEYVRELDSSFSPD